MHVPRTSPARVATSTLLLMLLLTGCQPSNSQEPRKTAQERLEEEYVVPKPNAKELLQSTAPGYVTPSGTSQECLGRLVFDVLRPVQWPVVNRWRDDTFEERKFSENVRDAQDRLKIGDVDVATVRIDETSNLEKFAQGHVGSVRYQIERILSEIASRQESADDRQRRMATASVEGREELKRARANDLDAVKELQEDLAVTRDEVKPVPLGIPESFGFWENGGFANTEREEGIPRTSILYAYIERNGYIYAFKSKSKLDKAAHLREFLPLLQRFRPRAAGEIPKDLGICIPYGFIADDGKSIIFNRMSIRYDDAPGVLYTIQTSNVDPRLGPETTTLTAAGRALAGYIGGYEKELVDKYVTKKIGPRIVKIGGLTAQQGGFGAQKPDNEGKPMNVYSVFTGYGGWQDTFVLPSILVDMRSYTRLEAPELAVNPPPFDQSMERLNALLKSIRLRPTQPPMPELANLPTR